ncbi:MAG TPA: TonB-dependent receptor plug domain-containing protein, partial [Flavobacterium sp.]|nr:TonB-dependent receptor plug domain-containing protein [Flavobacterium sp.]
MNTGKLIFIALLATLSSFAQDTIRQLDEVRVADVQWRVFSRSRTLKVVPDSLLGHQNSLKTLLSRTTALYFRENGAGMVASVSFRGTTASQTAVVWNGIAINSLLNGQTDFNTILTEGFGQVVVRPGGGGVGYGSGAIGGTVHLDNVFRYGREFQHSLYSRYGSFDTYGVAYHIRGGSEQWSVDATLSRNESQNDYAIPGVRNRNGH